LQAQSPEPDRRSASTRAVRAARCVLIAAVVVAALAHVLATKQPVFSDEFLILGNFWDFVQDRTIIPSHTRYPAFYSYITAPVTGAVFALSLAAGRPPSVYDLSEWAAYHPQPAVWPARLVSLACWALCAWAVHRMALEALGSRRGALLAAATFAAAVGTLEYSGYGLPDTAMMALVALALLFALRVARGEEARRNALIAGVLAGLAVATKYTAVSAAVPLLVAARLGGGSPRRRSRIAAIMAGCGLVAFIVGCPGWLLAPGHYWRGLAFEREHMAIGHLGYFGVPVLGQLELLATADPVLLALAVAGCITWAVAGRRGGREFAVLATAALAALALAAPARKQSLQYIFVLYPAMALMVAWGMAALSRGAERTGALILSALLLAVACWGLAWGCRVALVPDSVTVARQWINNRVPEGATLAVDWIDVPRLLDGKQLARLRAGLRSDFMRRVYAGLRGFQTVEMRYDARFLRETEADYIVTSSTCYSRFFSFGLFTGRPPSKGTPLRSMFEQRHAFYEALLSGRYGWRVEHGVYTGNGPRVLIFHRAE